MGRDLSARICYGVIVEFGTDYFTHDDSLRIDPEPLDEAHPRPWLEYRIKQQHGITIPDTPNYPDSAEHGGRYSI